MVKSMNDIGLNPKVAQLDVKLDKRVKYRNDFHD